jgi:hypothetical protein
MLRVLALLVASPGLAPTPAHAHAAPGRPARGIKVPQIEDIKAAIDQRPGQAFDVPCPLLEPFVVCRGRHPETRGPRPSRRCPQG